MLQPNSHAIRAMVPGDCDAVGALYRQLDAIHVERLPWLFQHPPQSPRDESFFEQILGNERAAVFVADDGGVVGFVLVRLVDTPEFPLFVPQTRGMVEAIFVTPENRRGGLGAALMQAATTWAAGQGAQGMDLVVYDFNENAGSAFAAMGYVTQHRKMSRTLE